MYKIRAAVTVGAAFLACLVVVPTAASADTIHPQGFTSGTRYRLGNPSLGGITYAVGLQVAKNSAGLPVNVQALGRINKLAKASRVQVDSVALGTWRQAIVVKNVPVNSGPAAAAASVTPWKALTPGTCTLYRARATFSVRWADGSASRFTILSPLSKVCRPGPPPAPTKPPKPADRNCGDFSTQAQAQAFFNYYYPYYGDFAHLDDDHDLVACEALP